MFLYIDLIGHKVTVELRNGSELKGILKDAQMNMTMILRDGNNQDIYIHGQQVKYVHIPDEIDVLKTIQQ